MPKRMLTELVCERTTPPATGRIEIFDACSPLVLRVTASGHKTFSVYYRFEGKHRRYTIGSFPAVKLTKARQLARDALEKVDHEVDPSAEKRAA